MVKVTIDGAQEQEGASEGGTLTLDQEGADEEAPEGWVEASEGDDGAAEEEDSGLVVQIGDDELEEDEAAKAPQWVRDLRKRTRDLERENRELKAGKQPEAKELGPKPDRADFDYDDDAYDAAFLAWQDRKRDIEADARKREEQEQAQTQAWQGKLSRYAEKRTALGAKDYEDAETMVVDTLSVTQQGIIVQGADNPALVTYALGKNPTRLKELAALSDPIEFAFAVSKLEGQLKIKDRGAPPPERTVRGSTGAAVSSDATIDRLRAEAAKTGDYSKVIAYKRQKRAS